MFVWKWRMWMIMNLSLTHQPTWRVLAARLSQAPRSSMFLPLTGIPGYLERWLMSSFPETCRPFLPSTPLQVCVLRPVFLWNQQLPLYSQRIGKSDFFISRDVMRLIHLLEGSKVVCKAPRLCDYMRPGSEFESCFLLVL